MHGVPQLYQYRSKEFWERHSNQSIERIWTHKASLFEPRDKWKFEETLCYIYVPFPSVIHFTLKKKAVRSSETWSTTRCHNQKTTTWHHMNFRNLECHRMRGYVIYIGYSAIKCMSLRWAKHVARMWEKRKAQRVYVRKLVGEQTFVGRRRWGKWRWSFGKEVMNTEGGCNWHRIHVAVLS
jgi:hypothetical protein